MTEYEQARRIYYSASNNKGSDSWYLKRVDLFKQNGLKDIGIKTTEQTIFYPLDFLGSILINPQTKKVFLYWYDWDDCTNISSYDISQLVIQLHKPSDNH